MRLLRSYTAGSDLHGGRAPQQWLDDVQRLAVRGQIINRLTGWLTTRLPAPPSLLLGVPLWSPALAELTGSLGPAEAEPNGDDSSPGRRSPAPARRFRFTGGRQPNSVASGSLDRLVNRPGFGADGQDRSDPLPGPGDSSGITGSSWRSPQSRPMAHNKRRPPAGPRTVDAAFLKRKALGQLPTQRLSNRRALELPSPRGHRIPSADPAAWATHWVHKAGRQLELNQNAVLRRTASSGQSVPAAALYERQPDRTKATGGEGRLNGHMANEKRPTAAPNPLLAHPDGEKRVAAASNALLAQWKQPLAGAVAPQALLTELAVERHAIPDRPVNPKVTAGAKDKPPTAGGGPRLKRPPVNNQPSAPGHSPGDFAQTTDPTAPTLLPHGSSPDEFSAAHWLGVPAVPLAEPRARHSSRLPPAAVEPNEEPAVDDAAPTEDLIQLAENVKRILDEEARRFGIDV